VPPHFNSGYTKTPECTFYTHIICLIDFYFTSLLQRLS
jgi:hypothetical protein